jgi:hypothetical protein
MLHAGLDLLAAPASRLSLRTTGGGSPARQARRPPPAAPADHGRTDGGFCRHGWERAWSVVVLVEVPPGRLEVVPALPTGDLLAEQCTLRVRGSEVDPAPDAGVDDLLERLREALEVPRLRGEPRALDVERDPVGTEEVLHHVQRRAGHAAVARRVVREARRRQRRDRGGRRRSRPPRFRRTGRRRNPRPPAEAARDAARDAGARG